MTKTAIATIDTGKEIATLYYYEEAHVITAEGDGFVERLYTPRPQDIMDAEVIVEALYSIPIWDLNWIEREDV